MEERGQWDRINTLEKEPVPRVYFWQRLFFYSLCLPVIFVAFRVYDYGFDYLTSKAFLNDCRVLVLPIMLVFAVIISVGEYIRLKLWHAKHRRPQ